jgi:hypothetical protein
VRVTVVTRHRNSPFSCRYFVTNCRKNCGAAPTSGALPWLPATTSKKAASDVLESRPACQPGSPFCNGFMCTAVFALSWSEQDNLLLTPQACPAKDVSASTTMTMIVWLTCEPPARGAAHPDGCICHCDGLLLDGRRRPQEA